MCCCTLRQAPVDSAVQNFWSPYHLVLLGLLSHAHQLKHRYNMHCHASFCDLCLNASRYWAKED
jgi:hypothetical protein